MAVVHAKKKKAVIKPTNEGDMAMWLSGYFDPRRNLIVPNVSWGLLAYEADLLVMTPADVVKEIEIKVSRADLKNDCKKGHGHRDRFIDELYYAIPKYLENCIDLIPQYAGVLVVDSEDRGNVSCYRRAEKRNYELSLFEQGRGMSQRPTEKEMLEFRVKLSRLGVLRIWDLKQSLSQANEDYHYVRRNLEKARRIIKKLLARQWVMRKTLNS